MVHHPSERAIDPAAAAAPALGPPPNANRGWAALSRATTFAVALFPLSAIAPFAALAAVVGCSSSPAPPRCDPKRCPSGESCIDVAAAEGPVCRKACTRQDQCPYGALCNDAQPVSFCVSATIPIGAELPGRWAAPCSSDAQCDTVDTFNCYGKNPTDANAFCTLFDCAQDSDCRGGWWCALLNEAPNLLNAAHSFGPTRAVCLPRDYCAPCSRDHDCPPAPNGTQQHCVQDVAGAGFCAPQCGNGSNCPLDAVCSPLSQASGQSWGVCAQSNCKTNADCTASGETCVGGVCRSRCRADSDCPASNGSPQRCPAGTCMPQVCASDDDCPPSGALGYVQHCNAGICTPECGTDGDCNRGQSDQRCVPISVCTPRAGVCKGDGTLCSPCRSDADCAAGGFCLEASYSTERFCSQAASPGQTCTSTSVPKGACPSRPTGASSMGVACTFSSSDTAPANQCIGEVTLAGMPSLGCWTVNR